MESRHFEENEHARLYSQYRQTLPESIFKTIVDYYAANKGKECNYDLAVDVGCGNGQSSIPLCKYFHNVIGVDISEQQINCAPNNIENLRFSVCPAENLNVLSDASVDVVTTAQALHWLDRTSFYREVRRVLKPGGVFVAYGYGKNIPDEPRAETYMREDGLLAEYWPPECCHVNNHYRDITHPFQDWERIEDNQFTMEWTLSVDDCIGYLSSWCAWVKYLHDHPGSQALAQLRNSFREIYKVKNNPKMTLTFPLFMLIGRKPN